MDEAVIGSLRKDFLLSPTGQGSDRLQEHRIPVSDASPVELTIGRKAVKAGVFHNFISRCHLILTSRERKLWLRSKVKMNCVAINRTAVEPEIDIELHEQDIITLLAPTSYFNYIVSVVDCVDPPRKSSPPAGGHTDSMSASESSGQKKRRLEKYFQPTSSSVQSAGAQCVNKSQMMPGAAALDAACHSSDAPFAEIHNATECAVCLQLMARAYSVVPCGHNFCYTCLSDWMRNHKKCPTCSGNISDKIPSRVLDSIIRATLVGKDAAELEDYEKRYAYGGSVAAADLKKPAAGKPPVNKNKSPFFRNRDLVDLSK